MLPSEGSDRGVSSSLLINMASVLERWDSLAAAGMLLLVK